MESFGLEIVETARAMRRDFDRRASGLGATRAQWRVLVLLARQGGSRQVDLAEALDVEPISLCRMIDRLEEAGLVERRRDEEDRRAWNIHLTEKASPVLDGLQDLGQQFHEDALAGISPEEQSQALSVLARVRANLAGLNAPAVRKVS